MDTDSREAFEENYKKDFQLEHTKIEYALYYDEEEGKYVKATLELFGKSSLINTYTKNNEVWKQSRSNTTGDILEYRILDIRDNMLVMDLNNSSIKVYYDSYLLIKQHYDNVNSNHIEEMRTIAKSINQKVDNYMKDEELVLMINNFLNDIPDELYLSPILVIQVETYIAYNNKNCGELFLLLSDEIERASHSKIENNQVGNRIYEGLLLENNDLIHSYFDNGLNLLCELIQDRYSIDTSISIYVTYILINRLVMSKFAKEYKKEYGDYFDNISNMTLDETVETYFCIDTINHGNINIAGKFIYYLMDNKKFECSNNYLKCYNEFVDSYKKAEKLHNMNVFKKKLQKNKSNSSHHLVTIDDIDLMNGAEFEQFVAQLFSKLGYQTEVTKCSGDQGIDVIAEKNGTKIGIQAKCYAGSVGNSAVQEVVAGIHHYKLSKGIVITNSTFTNSAIELANSNGVVLWNRNILKEKLVLLD